MLNKEYIVFLSRVIHVAREVFRASCGGKEAEKYVQQLFSEYEASGKPTNIDEWLSDRMHGDFQYLQAPPVWVENEPSWPFYDDRPMIFIEQMELPDNEVAREKLTTDVVLYIFGIRIKMDRGYRAEFQVVMQIKGLSGSGEW